MTITVCLKGTLDLAALRYIFGFVLLLFYKVVTSQVVILTSVLGLSSHMLARNVWHSQSQKHKCKI